MKNERNIFIIIYLFYLMLKAILYKNCYSISENKKLRYKGKVFNYLFIFISIKNIFI